MTVLVKVNPIQIELYRGLLKDQDWERVQKAYVDVREKKMESGFKNL